MIDFGRTFTNITSGHENFDGEKAIHIAYITGIIDSNKVTKFERSVFRMTRGKAILSNVNFPQALMDDLRMKNPEKYQVRFTPQS